jgi:chromosome segregation ATPase
VTPVASARPAVQVPDLQQAVADILEFDAQRTAYIDALERKAEQLAREAEEALQEAGRLRARVEELEAVLRQAVDEEDHLVLNLRHTTTALWRARVALGLDGATGHRDIRAEGSA